jgi:cyclic pyranopterin phosphate synthase
VLAGIDEAINAELTPLKINFVLLKDFNERELESMLEYCATRNIRLQLIELHEIEDIHAKIHSYFASHHVDAEDVLRQVSLPIERVEYRDMQNRKIIYFQNGSSVETVKMTPSFCNNCTKLRITADGRIKPCMMKSGNELDLLGAINKGYTRQELRSLILKAVKARVPYMKQEVEECE